MKPEIKAKWLEALRSGAYQQGEGTLRDEGKYCCLGVLCDIYIKEVGQGHWDPDGAFETEAEMGVHYPPPSVCLWAGFETSAADPEHDYDPRVGDTSVASMNDRGDGFAVIAEAIEKYL